MINRPYSYNEVTLTSRLLSTPTSPTSGLPSARRSILDPSWVHDPYVNLHSNPPHLNPPFPTRLCGSK